MMIRAQLRFATTGVSTELRARDEPDGAAPRPLGDRAPAPDGELERCAPPGGVLAERCAPLGRGCCTVDGPLGRGCGAVDGPVLGRGCCAVDGPLDRRGVVFARSDDPRDCCDCGACGPDGRGCERACCGGIDGAGAGASGGNDAPTGAGIFGGPEFIEFIAGRWMSGGGV
jgi:hypothetical protein